jgi:hypothetical protein
MGWWKLAAIGAACGAFVGVAAMTAWYLLFPPGAPSAYLVFSTGTAERYARLNVDGVLVVKIIVFFICLGAAALVGLAAVRVRLPRPRRRIFDAASVVALWTLAGAAITAVVYQVDHSFVSSRTRGHWPSAEYDFLVPAMPAIGLLIGAVCAGLWLKLSSRHPN